jgi:hypothetical protein
MKPIRIKLYSWIDITVLIFIFLFLLSFFRPELLLLKTTINGGDTGSHYPCAAYLMNVLLPQGKIMGWMQGNYAGFPLFYHYFPLPFLIMALLGNVFSLEVSFKLVSVLGVFFLPVCAYLAFRAMSFKFPVPILAAIFSLPFLFNDGNSMWGGNIPSTLAGEFCYSIGFSLALLFAGTLYRGVRDGRFLALNAVLILLIGLSHAYAFIFSLICGSFFLISGFRRNFKYLLAVYGTAFLLLAFWSFPLLANLPFTTSFVVRWAVHSMLEIFPVIIIPFCGLGVISLALNIKNAATLYFLYTIILCSAVYFVAPFIGILDIRFIPFIQMLLCVFGAATIVKFADRLKLVSLLPLILFLATTLWVNEKTTFISSWIQWNYSGYEKKSTWGTFHEINSFLKKSGTGRVEWEHTSLDEPLGSIRTSETLPYFAGRQTLEGIHMLGSPTAPFVFFIESETSFRPCNPIPDYFYSTLDLQRGVDHFELFNVEQFVVRSPELKNALKAYPRLKLEKVIGDYNIYRLSGHEPEFVTPLSNQPVLFTTNDWRDASYRWFTLEQYKDTFLAFSSNPDEKDMKRFPQKVSQLDEIRTLAYPDEKIIVKSIVHEESIDIETSRIGHPLLIKVSYHPNWRVTGAEKIYMASPSFMLIFPEEHHITLNFEPGLAERAGKILSFLGIIVIFLSPLWRRYFIRKRDDEDMVVEGKRLITVFSIIILLSAGAYAYARFLNPPPDSLLQMGKRDFDENRYAEAKENFMKAMARSKNSSGVRCEAGVYYATCLLRENRFKEAMKEFKGFIETYPNSFWTPQACFDLAHCYGAVGDENSAQDIYHQIIRKFPTTTWAQYAKPRLKEATKPNP